MDNKLVDHLNQFISLEKEVRAADTIDELGFIICNLTKRSIRYHQAIFWTIKNGFVHVHSVSGTAGFESDSPYIQWVRNFVKQVLKSEKANEHHLVEQGEVSEKMLKEWQEWTPDQVLWAPFVDRRKREIVGGILFLNDIEWKEYETSIIQELSEVYMHAFLALNDRKKERKIPLFSDLKASRKKLAIAVVIIGILLFPIQQSVLAPAEIVAKKPIFVTSSLNGVVETIHVDPNQKVKKGDLLFELDATELTNKYKIASNEYLIAQEKLRKANQYSFNNEEGKSELYILESEAQIKKLERDYLKYLLDRVKVYAQNDGIVIFNDKKDWIGKPVSVGERIMELADEKKMQLSIQLPVTDGLVFEKNSDVTLFLDAYPLDPVDAYLTFSSFKSVPTADQSLAYSLKAEFPVTKEITRIGLKGTAKIYGSRVSLIYYLLRKPISYIRQNTGI